MNANVGGGVFVGGSGVNDGIIVGDSIPVGESATGWKGVGVGGALGSCVTSTSVGGSACPCGEAQEERKSNSRKRFDRRGIFI